jgi:hypothetical protein
MNPAAAAGKLGAAAAFPPRHQLGRATAVGACRGSRSTNQTADHRLPKSADWPARRDPIMITVTAATGRYGSHEEVLAIAESWRPYRTLANA